MATPPTGRGLRIRIHDPQTIAHIRWLQKRTDRTLPELVRIAIDLLAMALASPKHTLRHDLALPARAGNRKRPSATQHQHPTRAGEHVSRILHTAESQRDKPDP